MSRNKTTDQTDAVPPNKRPRLVAGRRGSQMLLLLRLAGGKTFFYLARLLPFVRQVSPHGQKDTVQRLWRGLQAQESHLTVASSRGATTLTIHPGILP